MRAACEVLIERRKRGFNRSVSTSGHCNGGKKEGGFPSLPEALSGQSTQHNVLFCRNCSVSPRYARQLSRNAGKKKALLEVRETLARMGGSPETALLRQKPDDIFPPQPQREDAASL